MQRGEGPVAAAAIHDGHGLRAEIAERMVLSDADRLREEDPFTGQAIRDVPTHIVARQSRFEADLNRDSNTAVYRTPEQCWGLKVWRAPLEEDVVGRSLDYHRRFYATVAGVLDEIAADYPRFVLLDVHSYNHRRDGPGAPATPAEKAPEINIGTFSMPRDDWAWLIDPLMDAMRDYDFGGRHLDVRENVAFQGKGELTRFVHERYPRTGCAIAIEFKKFFMDEWSGEPDSAALDHMRGWVNHVAAAARVLLDGR
ncbi:MAG: N-formylglutamate amidohydrolase [Sphingomicrobium sp.]